MSTSRICVHVNLHVCVFILNYICKYICKYAYKYQHARPPARHDKAVASEVTEGRRQSRTRIYGSSPAVGPW